MITKAEIKEKIGRSPRWAERALVVLYDRQIINEQTIQPNGMGFSNMDAHILSSFAEQIGAGKRLTAKQLDLAFKRLPKYAGQLHQVVIEKMTIMHCSCGKSIVADRAEYRCLGCGYATPRMEAA